jgi:hypothetical protein
VAAFSVASLHSLRIEVKQYSVDIALGLGIMLLGFRLLEDTGDHPRRYLVPGLVGVLSVWFSNAAVLVLAGMGVALLLLARSPQPAHARRAVLPVVLPWLGASVAAGMAGSSSVLPRPGCTWTCHGPGICSSPGQWHDLPWPWRAIRGAFAYFFGSAIRWHPPISCWRLPALVLARRAQ